jgi:hypothetical protein
LVSISTTVHYPTAEEERLEQVRSEATQKQCYFQAIRRSDLGDGTQRVHKEMEVESSKSATCRAPPPYRIELPPSSDNSNDDIDKVMDQTEARMVARVKRELWFSRFSAGNKVKRFRDTAEFNPGKLVRGFRQCTWRTWSKEARLQQQ